MFERYVNPKIEALKGSIKLLSDQKDSINSQITDLNNTEKTIENLSQQITSNVDGLNNKISSHDEFKSLVETIKKHLGKSISDLKRLDKTGSIDTTLCKMVEQIKKEDDDMLKCIKEELTKHEENVKQKLDRYIDITKNGLSSVKKRMSELESKIFSYIGLGGTFQRLRNQLRAYYNNVDNFYISRNKFIRLHGGIESGRYENVKQNLSNLEGYRNEYRTKINQAGKDLNKLHTRLCCEGSASHVIEDFENHKGNYHQLLSQIPNFVNRLKQFEKFGDKIWRGAVPMKELIEITRSIESAKTIVDKNQEHLDKLLPHLLNDTLAIPTNDIHRLISDITILRRTISTSIKRLENTKLLIEYHNSFEEQKKEFNIIKINESGLEKIDKLICSIKGFEKGYEHLTNSVFQSNYKLLRKFEKGFYDSRIRGGRLKFFPQTMSLDRGPLAKIKNHIKKLKAIKSVSQTLSCYSIDLFLNYIEEPVNTDIDGLLKELKGIDDTLKGSWYIGHVGKISESYEENKSQINGSGSGNGNIIEEHVELIKRIPDKIAELHSKVRYYIVLLEIAKSVNETLEKVKGEAEKFKWIGFGLEYIRRRIGDITERYGGNESDIPALSLFSWELDDLNKFKETIGVIKYVQMMLNENIKRVKMNKSYLVYNISEIKEYQKILLGISKEIAIGFSRVGLSHLTMPLVLVPSPAFGLGLHGSHGLWLPLISSPLLSLSIRIGLIMAHLSLIRIKLERIVGSGLIGCIEGKVSEVDCRVTEVESSIESVIVCFLKCSNESNTNTIESTKTMLTSGGKEYNNQLAKPLIRR